MTVAGTADGAAVPDDEAVGTAAPDDAVPVAVDGAIPAARVPAAAETEPVASGARLLNIANILTIMRLVLVPVFVVFLFVGPHEDAWRLAAFAAYAVAAVTDQIDGAVARRHGLVTEFGAFVDPVADKALTGAALVSLSILNEIPWAVTAVIVVRELGVTLLRLWVIRHGVIAASRGGKIKTLLLNISLGLAVLPLTGLAADVSKAVLAVALVVAVATGVDYVARALKLRNTSRAARQPAEARAGEAPDGAGRDVDAG
ncbi:CDP-alcohol phosphatidyltransferase family protein [Pseudofrankia inefficax]|uniref:CDP-diacylglycerol/glycerol-3-phosphate 3-phosphatidyltransferase n=1 Tax=Pseudofrankia inefficax (strain DSM 45817 / CECT 9037 / DDB 130130 / EuI1c) TaxID=298654 RepID=E3J124_PSEI1|nr:CDP-diacylglycerol/glycerol-3-phosphate 3-phosphatidyltransferase [Pseudofrankia inefficax]